MANSLYPLWKQQLLQGTGSTALSGTVKAVLVDTGTYTYNAAHQYYSNLTGVAGGTPPTLTSKTFTNGVFDAADTVFLSVPAGVTLEAIVLYCDTGTTTTSPLIAYLDTGITNMPVTPNGGDITVVWNASGIFAL